MAFNAPPAGYNRPATRRQSVVESPAPTSSVSKSEKSPAPTSSVSKSEKSDKMKGASASGESSKDKKDSREGNDGKEKEKGRKEKAAAEDSKVDMVAEFAKFRADLGKMFKDSETRMGKLIKESENRMSEKLNTIESSFSEKIEGLREEMRTDIKVIKDEVESTKSEMMEEMNTVKETVSDMEKSVQHNSDRMDNIEEGQKDKIEAATAKLDVKLKELDDKLMLLEKQDRKYNLLFYGFREDKGENVYNVIRQSLINDLNLDEERVRNMYFAAGHRVPTKAAGPNLIIIRCTSLEDRELILSGSKHYGGMKKRVVVDLPNKMKEQRSTLAKKAYEIRKSEDKQTRIKDKGLDVYLEVRNNASEKWVKRVVEMTN